MKTFEDRDYQARAIEENLNYLETKDGNLCCCMPGGSGKAYVIARMAQILAKQGKRVLMLVNNGKLVKQNTETLQAIWPNAPLGVYASQLKRRELDCKITYAMIQSIHRHASTLGHIDVILVDEAHAINNKQQGTYRKFISDLTEINPAIKIQGYSASPYRLGQGMVTDGDDALFTDISEPVTIKELLEMGFLSPLRSPETPIQLNTEGLKKTAGEFSLSDMQNRFNTDEANKEIALHMKENRSDRNHWLIFCSGIEHCENFAKALNDIGITAESLTQKNNNKQDEILERFESGKTRALCNFGILTTGYDFPALDYIALIRKTNSPGLYLQIIVRGMRIFEGKENCFIDDFCGNIEQHGPVIAIQPPPPPGKRKRQKAPIKICPTCKEQLPASVMVCYHCGHRFEAKEKTYELSTADVLGLRPNIMEVTGWRWSHHISRSSGKEMIKCIYYGSLSQKPITEYFAVTHEGKAGRVAVGKIQQIAANSNDLDLNQAQNLYELSDLLNRRSTPPAQIKYSKNGKFFSVDKRIWA
jgi:DNA repair protein RadD